MLFLGSLLCATFLLTSSAPLMERLPETSICSDGLCFVYPEDCPILDCTIILKIKPQGDDRANFIISAEQDSTLDNILMLSISSDNGAKKIFTCYPEEHRATVISEVDGQIEEIGSAQVFNTAIDIDLLQCDLAGPLTNNDKYIVSLGNFDGSTASVNNEYALYPYVGEDSSRIIESAVSGTYLPGLPVPLALESLEAKSDLQKKEVMDSVTSARNVDPKDSQASVQRDQFDATEDTTIDDSVVEKSLPASSQSTSTLPATSTEIVNSTATAVSTTTATDVTSSIKSTGVPKDRKKPAAEDSKKDLNEIAAGSSNSTHVPTTKITDAETTSAKATTSSAKDKNQPSLRSMDTDLDEETTLKPLDADRKNSTTKVPTKTTTDSSDPDDDTVEDSAAVCNIASLLLSLVAAYYIM